MPGDTSCLIVIAWDSAKNPPHAERTAQTNRGKDKQWQKKKSKSRKAKRISKSSRKNDPLTKASRIPADSGKLTTSTIIAKSCILGRDSKKC